jgi:hypothetical protein
MADACSGQGRGHLLTVLTAHQVTLSPAGFYTNGHETRTTNFRLLAGCQCQPNRIHPVEGAILCLLRSQAWVFLCNFRDVHDIEVQILLGEGGL